MIVGQTEAFPHLSLTHHPCSSYVDELVCLRVNKDQWNHTIFYAAFQEVVRVLIHHSADVNARDKNWQTPLHVAAANNALRCAEVIIPLLSSVNVSDRGGRTALHHAALNGHTEVLQGETCL